MKCIYCLTDQTQTSFKTTEHVLPQAFGLFKNNLTLNGIVCDGCNKYMGDNLDIVLAKGTLEGAWRYDHGIRKPEEYKSLGKRDRVVIKVEEGVFKGSYAYKQYSREENAIVIIPAPQVAFLNPVTNKYDFYLLANIPPKRELCEKGYNFDDPKCILFPMQYIEAVKEALKDREINFKLDEELDYPHERGQQWLCYVEETKDDIVFRAVAKIAFNYHAYGLHKRSQLEVIFHKDFDVIRNYIRYGKKSDYPLVVPSDTPILGDEPKSGKRREGHLVTVNWAQDGVSILSQVSLFNWITYKICLARECTTEHQAIKRGNFFDFNSHQILVLGQRSGN